MAFISHQWLSYDHADPDFEQLGVLKRVAERIKAGELKRVEANWLTHRAFAEDAQGEGAMAFEIGEADLRTWVETGCECLSEARACFDRNSLSLSFSFSRRMKRRD